MPLHFKAREFAKSGLFAGLRSFEELEKRIAKIPANKEKGDAFEVFAEAYLVTQRRHEIREAWPLDAVPLDLLRKLKLPLKDYGVDGVTLTMLGGHQVYQVKFRSGRTPLTWEELSTFMGLSDSPEIQSKVVITNCDELPAVINDRHNFFCIRGSDFDRLTTEDFKVIAAWVSKSVLTINKSKPFPHQQEALDALLPALKVEDRVSAIMACGTGKTLTALWTTEQLGASKVLVLLPSLALLRQTLHEWLKETSLDLAYLCVCSDPSVKDDADSISTAQSDLDFEVSTDSSTVRQFLDVPFKGTKVIFSTYQSASVVGKAMNPSETFDLGIFDEAHKTAGREGRNYGYALEDRNIPISKRLFVTATPRHYNPSKRNKQGEATVAFSMDEPKVYGPQSYVLSFGEAARRKIICGYKVIISVITSEQVNDEILSKGTVKVKGDEIRARQVANQIALRDAVAQYGVGKIFTFHSTVKSAASFVADGNEGVRAHLPEFTSLHVSGAMPTARRERVMKEFRSAPRAVMSNARCLTEGVDVPAVNMVAFLSPKKSKVDIVQAIGRAMRRSEGKETGYILIPLYLEQKAGESIETAVARANFEEVWDILQSLQEQDEVLAELIRDMAVAKGSGKGFDDSRFSDRIAFTGPDLTLENIRQAVTTRALDRLESYWDLYFGKLQRFKVRTGHCRVPQKYESDLQLGTWVTNQRRLFIQGKLLVDRVNRLQKLGFEWDPLRSEWEQNFDYLKAFYASNGHCRVPHDFEPDPKFARWIVTQRVFYSDGKLSVDRIQRLNEISFDWNTLETDWKKNFSALSEFKKKNGHCRVARGSSINPELARWVQKQRSFYSIGKVSKERVAKLERLGFEWDPNTSDWYRMFQLLKDFQADNAHCRIPASTRNTKLRNWVSNQRSFYRRGKLSKKRISELEELGFEWDILTSDWDKSCQELETFKKVNGHCRVPRSYNENLGLAQWVQRMRDVYSKAKLSKVRITRLESLGFEWDPKLADWEALFYQLNEYKLEHGDCLVRIHGNKYSELGRWVDRQRQNYANGLMPKDLILKLEGLGFIWDPHSSYWETMFEKLKDFVAQHGHCRVPTHYTSDKQLGNWVSGQRTFYNKRKLTAERIAKLESIGFEWDPKSADWNRFLVSLQTFKANYGHCRVPFLYREDARLGPWVSIQRKLFSKGKLPPERIATLEAIGFEWKLR